MRLSDVQSRVGEREVKRSNIWKAKNLPCVIAPYHCLEIFSPLSEKPYLLGFGAEETSYHNSSRRVVVTLFGKLW